MRHSQTVWKDGKREIIFVLLSPGKLLLEKGERWWRQLIKKIRRKKNERMKIIIIIVVVIIVREKIFTMLRQRAVFL